MVPAVSLTLPPFPESREGRFRFTPPGLSSRAAQFSDMDFCRTLYRHFRADEMSSIMWPDAQKLHFLDSQFDLQHYHFATHFPNAEFLILEKKKRPIGRLYLDASTTQWTVIDIGFLPEARGMGYGRTVMQHILDQAKMARAHSVNLHVNPANIVAAHLYRSLGFVPLADLLISDPYMPMRWQNDDQLKTA